MFVEQIYTGCLSEAAYYIESEGEAAVIDPLRETSPYLEKAAARNAEIKYVFETHFHADFVSGHVDLSRAAGAPIVYGPKAKPGFAAHIAKDGEVFKLGKVTIEVLHTPGHTPESSCYLLRDPKGKPYALFSGDTLFIGDVGRPDLAVSSDVTEEDLAGMLYNSLRKKVMTLPDDVIVYPAHGAGSACGKNISSETQSTIGEQKQTNYALQKMSKKAFVEQLTTGILPAPHYFAENAKLNMQGYPSIKEVMMGSRRLTARDVEQLMDKGAMVIDCRTPQEFADGHVPGSIFIGLDGQFAIWAATLIHDLHTPIVVVAPKGRHREAILRLARVGFDNVKGYLSRDIRGWEERDLERIDHFDAELLPDAARIGKVIDVRKPGEYSSAHLDGAQSIPLDYLPENIKKFKKDQRYFLHCKSGYRSMIACSLLQRAGFEDLFNVDGGFDAIVNTNLPIVEQPCEN